MSNNNPQAFFLRWNAHHTTLVKELDQLLLNKALVDCTLAADGQYIDVHKVVLSACSPFLESLLNRHYKKHAIVILKDVTFEELESIIEYMYKGEVTFFIID